MKPLPYEVFDRLGVSRLAADKIEADPTLLLRTRASLVRWIESGEPPRRRFVDWIERIDRALADREALGELLAILRADDEDAQYLREFAPFGCLLTKAERRVFSERCAYAH